MLFRSQIFAMVVAKTGDYHGEDLMVWAYETNKVGAFAAGNQGHLMLSKYAPVPPSLDAIVWGQLGIEDGLKDYKKTHPQQDGKLGDAILLDKDLIEKQTHIPQSTIEGTIKPAQDAQRELSTQAKLIQNNEIMQELRANIKALQDLLSNFSSQAVQAVSAVCKGSPAGPTVQQNVSGQVIGSPGAAAGDSYGN